MLRLIASVAARLSPRTCWILGWLLGVIAFSLLRLRRGVTMANIRAALRVETPAARAVAARAFIHLGIAVLETLQLGRLSAARAREILGAAGLARLRGLLAQGQGAIVVSGHLGAWDLLACAAARCGLPVNVVTREIRAGWINRFWMAERRACGVRLLPSAGSAVELCRALRQNEIVALVIDQHEPGGMEVDFFGRPAWTGTAAARLARVMGAPIVPVFLLRTRPGEYRLEVREPVSLQRSYDAAEDYLVNTQRCTRAIEDAVRQAPEQWLWLHRRWKSLKRSASHQQTGGL